MDVRLAARYPFLKGSAALLKEKGVGLEGLISSRAYERARMLGKDRVMEAVEFAKVLDRAMISEADAMNELLSYPVARMMVSCLGDEKFVHRYAVAEAKLVGARLAKEAEKGKDRGKGGRRTSEDGMAFVMATANELGLDVGRAEDMFAVDFGDFLRSSSSLKDRSWKLVNQDVRDGEVVVTDAKLVRLLQQMVALKIASELPLPVNDDILAALSDEVEDIRQALEIKRAEHPERDFGRISIVRFPPCMRKLLEMIRAGENVPHTGRFALVAFLHTLGMDADTILSTFASSADFDESKSRYQIQHITGEISGTEYTPPECSTMKSYGICYEPDSLCERDWMGHPLKYYRLKGKKPKRRAKVKGGSARSSPPSGPR